MIGATVATASVSLGLRPAAADALAHAPAGPLSWKTLLELGRIDVPTMANTIEDFDVRPRNEGFCRPEIACRFRNLGVMVGYAGTCKTRSVRPRRADESYAPRRDFFDYILSVPAPRVMVIEDADDPPGVGSYWGEMHATQHQALACVGSVTNGCVRDLDEVEAIGFHLFSQHIGASHAYCHIIEFGKPVRIGGLLINSGDLLHGDKHGVQNVPLEIAAQLPAACRKKREGEFDFIDFYRAPDFTIEKMRDQLQRR